MSTFARWPRGFVLILFLAGCAHRPISPVIPQDLPWTPFYWVQAQLDSLSLHHGAILVETSVRPRQPPALLQLDLAASGTMPFGYPSEGRPWAARRHGQIAGLLTEVMSIRALGARDSSIDISTREIGTLGLPLYETQALIIDFQRFRVVTIPAPPNPLQVFGAGFVSAALAYDGNRVVLPLIPPKGRGRRALLDTGLCPFEIWTTKELWAEWTGMTPDAKAVTRYRIPSQRGDLVFVAAPARGVFTLGEHRFTHLSVVFLEQGPDGAAIESWPNPVDAVLGPSFFSSGGALFLDLPHRRFSVFPRGRE